MNPLYFHAFFSAFLVLCSACATQGTRSSDSTTINLAEPFSALNYAVSTTDTLSIDVYREAELTGKYYVDPSGTINMPLLGRVSVANLSVQAIEKRIEQGLAGGYIVNPDVRVSVIHFRPIYVSGEIMKPGKYVFTPGMTVQQAIVLAGGATRFAAKKYYLQRNNVQESQRMRVDGNSLLFPGDVITVGERLF
ncbi:MAG: polysaccharide biosynthesis/export family protein [Oceanococcus sp.]